MNVLPLLALCGTLAVADHAWAAEAGGSAELTAQIIARLGQVSQRSQHFHETREIAALTHPLRSTGVLVFHRPAYLEKRTQAPRAETLVIDADTVSIQRGSGEVRRVMLAQNPALALLATTLRAPLQGDLAALAQDYALQAQGDLGAWTLTMVPLSAQAVRLVRMVVLKGRNNAVDSLMVTHANGDVQILTIDP